MKPTNNKLLPSIAVVTVLLLVASLTALAGKPQPPPTATYAFTDLGPVAFANSATKAYGITEPDANGVVLMVGGGYQSAPSPNYAMAYTAVPAGLLSASVLPASRKGRAAVNDWGMTAYRGYSESQTTDVGMVEVPGVGTVELPSWFYPTAVNNLGQVAGSFGTGAGDGMVITVNNDGTYSIEQAEALWGFVPYAINDFGEMTGLHVSTASYGAAIAWFESDGLHIQDLIVPQAVGDHSLGAGINNFGDVVGSRNGRPFRWTLADGFTWLTPSNETGYAYDINDHGQIVGESWSNGYYYAFLWENGKLSDLNALTGVGTKSFRLGSADAINNAGQIVGRSDSYKGTNINFGTGSYLLTPNP